ncbi:MAG TPA: hypothetical protein VLA64_01610 [Azonexus sp.]|nr:hypothetical protein [Azonexus sp.]
MPSPAKPLFGLFAAAISLMAQADSVVCHVTYGGETRLIEARPATMPYSVAPTPIGSYFLFRIVFRAEPADLASIKLYAYTNRDTGPVIIHQASYAYPAANTPVNGFTGLNLVYETVRDSELQYWCELKTEATK